MFRVFLCLAGLIAVQAATTVTTTTAKPHHGHHGHNTGPTNEPSEKDSLKFFYDSHSHQMLLISNKNCYIFTLTDADRTAVHTDSGIKTIEVKLINGLATGTQTAVNLHDQPKAIQHACGHVQNTYTIM